MKCEKDVISGSNSSVIDYPMVATENETDGSQKVPHGANAKSARKESLKSAIRMQGQMVCQNGGKKGKTYVVKFAETDENVNKFEILDASGQAQKVITDTRNTQGLTRSKRQIKTPKRLLDSDAVVQLKPSSKMSKNIKQTNPEPDIKTLELPHITICKLNKSDLFVEIEVEPEFQLSPVEFIEEVNGRLKYGLSLSKEKNIVKDDEDAVEESIMEQNEQKPDMGGNEQKKDTEENEKLPKRKKKKKTAIQVDDLKDIPVQQVNNSNSISNETVSNTDETMTELQENESPCLESINDTTDEQTQTVQDDDNEDADYDPSQEADVEEAKSQKRLKEETKPKRKYTKRKAYNQDNTHYTVVTNEEGKRKFKCNFCGAEMQSGGNMRDHIRSHTGEKPFECEVCGKTFKSNNNLKGHMVVHSDERPYVCDICGFAFKQKGLLKIHRSRHNPDSSRFTCHICGKGFYSSTEVKKHIPSHTGEKNYECKICHKKFTQDSALARHRFVHTGSKPHMCEICGMTFVRKEHFRKHNEKFHSSDSTKVKTEIAHPSEIIVDIQGEATDATNNLIDKEMIYLELDGSVYSVPSMNDNKGTDVLYQAMEIPVQNTEIIIVTGSNDLDRKIEYSEL